MAKGMSVFLLLALCAGLTGYSAEGTPKGASATLLTVTPERTWDNETRTPRPEWTPRACATQGSLDETRYVTGDAVPICLRPENKAEVIAYAYRGQEVRCLAHEGDWYLAAFSEGREGYIGAEWLSLHVPEIRCAMPEEVGEPGIVVYKSGRLLELWDGTSLCGRWPVGLGWDPEGHKQVEGDGKTPEGSYYVCTRNGASRFYLSLGVSYPGAEDARRALEAGRIQERTYNVIAEANEKLRQPPWDTALGGEIMIHGNGSGSDWTAGCVAVDNEVMDILWRCCPIGTPITIYP